MSGHTSRTSVRPKTDFKPKSRWLPLILATATVAGDVALGTHIWNPEALPDAYAWVIATWDQHVSPLISEAWSIIQQ